MSIISYYVLYIYLYFYLMLIDLFLYIIILSCISTNYSTMSYLTIAYLKIGYLKIGYLKISCLYLANNSFLLIYSIRYLSISQLIEVGQYNKLLVNILFIATISSQLTFLLLTNTLFYTTTTSFFSYLLTSSYTISLILVVI